MKDLHTHTVFSDGVNTPEDMILAAIDRGLDTIGFSDHSYTPFDESYCIKKECIADYKRTVKALAEKYRDKIKVLLGIEQDFFAGRADPGYDYVIGSVHYVSVGDVYIPIDMSREVLQDAVRRYFDGDFYRLAELYFSTVAGVVEATGATIIGHFDLIRKFNGDGRLFDEYHPRYVSAARAALDRLLMTGVPFEINTGAISRGYREEPYPAPMWLAYIRAHGGKTLFSSDSHTTKTLAFAFEREW